MKSYGTPSSEADAAPAFTVHVRVHVRVLGEIDVSGPLGRGLGAARSRFHVRALLAVLAACTGGVPRDELLDALWPSQSPDAARNRLYHTIHLLKDALVAIGCPGDGVTLAGGLVRLDAGIQSDAGALLAAAAGAEAGDLDEAALQEALREARGLWAPGIELGALGERVRADIHHAQTSVLREAARRHAAGGDTPRRRELLNELLQLQPTEEWAYQELMRLDLAAGHPHAALKTHEVAIRMLAERLGLRPAPATAELAAIAAARLQDGAEPAACGSGPAAYADGFAPVLSSPPAACRLIGREMLIESVEQALAEEESIVALAGPIGIGKTALLAEAARRIAAHLRSRVCWITADDPAPAETALQRFVRSTPAALPDPAPQGPLDIEALMHAAAAQREILVFDDIDRLPESAVLIAAIRACSPRPRVLLSLQRPLPCASAEAVPVLAVPPLPVPLSGISEAEADVQPSVMLFLAHCSAQPDLSDPTQRAELVALLQMLEGWPLGIERAAARTVTMTPGEMLDALGSSLNPLSGGPVNTGGRQLSATAALDATVAALGPAAEAAYRCASAFDDSFTAAELAGMARTKGLNIDSPAAALLQLEAAGLAASEDQGRCWRLRRLPRVHARMRELSAALGN
jgi:DNA-binding SARP family transcriptional activator